MDAAVGRSGGGGMGPASLSWIDLKAMQDATGRRLTPGEARAVLVLDRSYLSAVMDRASK